jgi:hypothetical protein
MANGQFPAKAAAKHVVCGSVLFQCNNTSDPDPANTVDPGGLIASIVYSATAIQTLTLSGRWKYVHAVAQALDTTAGVIAKVTATTAGRDAANTIVLQTEIADGTPTALVAKDVVVSIYCYR